MDETARRENPYSASAGLRGRVKRRSRRLRSGLIVAAAFVLVLIVAPFISEKVIRLVVPPIYPAMLAVNYSWALTMLDIAGSITPCLIAGGLLGYKRISSSARVMTVWSLFVILLMSPLTIAIFIEPEQWAAWRDAIGLPLLFLQETIGIIVPIGFVLAGVALARFDRANRIRRRRRKDRSVRREARSS